MGLRIVSISIADTFGTTQVNFAPGTVTRVAGRNGSGKSSILRALLYVFGGGLDPSVIRKGAERSVVSFELSNGVIVTKITARIKPRRGSSPTDPPRYKADLEITDSNGEVINAPMTYLSELSEALAVDPSVLLRIDAASAPGKRLLAAELMKLVPISFGPEEINRACGIRTSDQVDFYSTDALALSEAVAIETDLDGLKKMAASVTEQRRRIGITRDDTSGTVNRLQMSLPEDDGVDYSAQLGSLEAESVEIERAIGRRKLEIETEKGNAIATAREIHNAACSAADKEYAEALAKIEDKRASGMATAKASLAASKDAINNAAVDELGVLASEAEPEQRRVSSALTVVKERMSAHSRAAALRDEIEIQLATCRSAGWKYEQLTGVLDRLEKLRLEKLNNLPVAGLVVEEGEAFLDGITWANVNLARRVEAVLQICTQRSGKLPLVILDDAEHLDAETRAAIETGLADAGFQVVEAIVSDDPLKIETVDSPVAA